MSNPHPTKMTEAEYLAFERESEIKHEYVRGTIYAMTGASRKHVRICWNLSGILYNKLRGKNCQALQSDMRVQVAPKGTYRYPDLAVVCDEPEFSDDQLDTLLNPIVLVEVLSDTSRKRDMGTKLEEYMQINTLKEYLIIEQDMMCVYRYSRDANNQWIVHITSDVK